MLRPAIGPVVRRRTPHRRVRHALVASAFVALVVGAGLATQTPPVSAAGAVLRSAAALRSAAVTERADFAAPRRPRPLR